MLDLIVRNATLADGRRGIDVGVEAGRIAAVAPHLQAEAGQTIDAQGLLLTPPFVDSHFHMDATLSFGLPRVNRSGTLLEGIALWGELKPLLIAGGDRRTRAGLLRLGGGEGLLAIRTHVDVCDPRLLAVEALLEVKKKVAPYIDLQLVAFPQDGVYRSPGRVDILKRALRRGVDVVGGIPHFERTMADGARSRCALFARSRRRGSARRHALRRDRRSRCRAMSRPWPPRRSASACRAGWRARISPRCTAWTTTTSPSCIPLMAEARRRRDRQSAYQHHAAGPPRYLSQAPRHDPGARADGGRHHRRASATTA